MSDDKTDMDGTSNLHMDTLAVHAGEEPAPGSSSVSPDIVLSTNFVVDPDAIGFSAASLEGESPYFYSRWATPTVDALERKLASLEGAEGCGRLRQRHGGCERAVPSCAQGR